MTEGQRDQSQGEGTTTETHVDGDGGVDVSTTQPANPAQGEDPGDQGGSPNEQKQAASITDR